MKTIKGYYGGSSTPCLIFTDDGWYCVEGSQNVNRTRDEIPDGVNVEYLSDYDCFTWPDGIHSEDDLAAAIEA